MNMGMSDHERLEVTKTLSSLLANTYVLYLKTQNFHWNVTGPMFQPLHILFESQYKALAEAVDEIAERIRALGEHTPASLSQYLEMSLIEESIDVPSAEGMVAQLLEDHETIVRAMRDTFEIIDDANDEVTADLFVQRMTYHEKTAWMLRAVLS
ncbi:MAG: Dps family protein [Gammaproteobacteria bacterium]